MKKAKNILLLVGIIPIIINLSTSVYGLLTNSIQSFSEYHLTLMLSNILFAILVLALPLILLVQNLKGKSSKAIAFVSIIASTAYIVRSLSLLFRSLPNYIVLIELGMIENYLTVVLSYIKNGGLFTLLGQVAVIIGSAISLRKEKAATTDAVNM